MSEYVYAGLTSQSIDIFVQDSSSTTGAGLSGLLFNSAGLVASYRKGATGARVAITLATQTVGGAWSSGGFVEIDATHMKGTYRFDIPNAAVDTEGFATLYFYGATNMLPTALRIDCRPLPADVRKFGGANGVFAAGIPETRVASVAPNAINAAAIADGAIDTATFAAGTTIPRVTLADTTTTNTDMRGTDGANTVAPTNLSALQVRTELATELARIDAAITTRSTYAGGAVASVTGAVGSVTAAVTLPTIPTDWITANGIATDAINAAAIAAGAIDTATFAAGTTIPRVTLVDTTTTNTDMRGTDGANTVAPTNLSALQVRTELATELARIDASVSSRSTYAGGAVASVTAAVALDAASVTAVQSGLATPADINAQMLDVLSVDTFAELSSPPAATSSLKDKLTWMFMWFRNKSTETATERKLFADDTTTVISTEAVSDNGTTFTKNEAS